MASTMKFGWRAAWLAGLCGAWLAVAAPVGAQGAGAAAPRKATAPTQKARAQARAAYAKGQELFEQGQFAEAEAAFVEAYGYVPNPVVLLGISEARQRQGNIGGAVEALEQYLEDRPDAPDQQEVEAKIAELKATPATIHVESDPPGAALVVDGRPTDKTTPDDLHVSPGEHQVTARLEGYQQWSEEVTAEPGGEQTLTLQLEAVPPPEPEPQVMGAGEGVPEPAAEPEAPAEEKDESVSTGVWVATGVAASALVAGTVLGFMALNQQSEFDSMPNAHTADKGERLALFADVTFGLALGAAVTGLVLYLTRDEGGAGDDTKEKQTGKTQATASPVVLPGGGGIAAEVTF